MFQLRKATIEDVLSIKSVLKETWLSTYKEIFPLEIIEKITSVWHSEKNLQKQIQNDKNINLLAYIENSKEIVGIITIQKLDENSITLSRIYILPEYQGKGIGKILFYESLKNFDKIEKVTLEVELENTKSINFYKKLGFTEVAEK